MTSSKKIELVRKTTEYEGFFKLNRYCLRHELYAGGMSRPLIRELLERGHAAAVLPFDPVRDEVVLIEQFRIGAYARGDTPWLLEIIAGVIHDGESAEAVARREAEEEADLRLDALEPVCGYYVSPGGTSEFVRVYCARVDAATAGGVHGLPEEGEDIRVVVMPFAEAMRALADGRVRTSPAVVALQWLALNHDDLRRRWGG